MTNGPAAKVVDNVAVKETNCENDISDAALSEAVTMAYATNDSNCENYISDTALSDSENILPPVFVNISDRITPETWNKTEGMESIIKSFEKKKYIDGIVHLL